MTKRVLSVAASGGLGVVMLVSAAAQMGHAQTSAYPTSDRPAGYVVFAKVVVDTGDLFDLGRRQDTVIQLTNTGQEARVVECFYVDATNRCSNAPSGGGLGTFCRTTADCRPGGQCLPQWSYLNNTIVLTPNQPVGWSASVGTDLSEIDGDGVITGVGPYFIGELKCIEVDGETIVGTTTTPIRSNDLKGEASIYDLASISIDPALPGTLDVRAYNAIGFQANVGVCVGGPTPGAACENTATCGTAGSCSINLVGNCLAGNVTVATCTASIACPAGSTCTLDDQNLCLGASPGSTRCPAAEYAGCPSILVVDHFFDGAEDPNGTGVVTTDLTLVPCSENLATAPSTNGVSNQTPTTAQILVYNEFEQRLSTTVRVDCFRETALSLIDETAGNEASSIFNVAVEGTLTGQTRIRPVLTGDLENGNGLLAIAEEFHTPETVLPGRSLSHSGAFNVDYVGTNATKGDSVRYNVGP